MRRTLLMGLVTLLAGLGAACEVALEAQSFPIDVTLIWDAPDPTEPVVGYRVVVNGTPLAQLTPPVVVSACPDGSANCIAQAIHVTGPGQISVTAVGSFGDSAPAILTVKAVSTPGHLRVKKP